MRDLPKRMMDATQDVARLVACLEEVRRVAAEQPAGRPIPNVGTIPTACGRITRKIDETLGENRG